MTVNVVRALEFGFDFYMLFDVCCFCFVLFCFVKNCCNGFIPDVFNSGIITVETPIDLLPYVAILGSLGTNTWNKHFCMYTKENKDFNNDPIHTDSGKTGRCSIML